MEIAVQKTKGQLEREISQRIRTLYKKCLGHKLSQANCQLFDSKIAIVLEDSVTQPEKFLVGEGETELIEEVHDNLGQSIYPQIKTLIEEILGVKVLDLLSDVTLETERTGIIVILDKAPSIRSKESDRS
ncbi:MAG: DUF2294 domain-containing protein [Leptolyngbyaceae cyanobacterium]